MKKLVLITFIGLFGTKSMQAQANKSVFLEVGGNGVGFSLNFDSRFTKSEKGFGYRVGIGLVPGVNEYPINNSTAVIIPVGLNYLTGKTPNYLEAGIGATYVSAKVGVFESDKQKAKGVGFIPSLGYRYAKTGKGFQGRLFLSPVIGSGG